MRFLMHRGKNSSHYRRVATVAALLVSAAASTGQSQENRATKAGGFRLPEHPAMWVNSRPISSEGLKGKAAVLWFYEEQCPRCKAKWPELIATANQFAGKPIVFIAVNSGNARGAVERYAGEVGLQWPIIVDSTREFERACGVGEISLQNIYVLATISAEGVFARGDASNLERSAERALAGAKWTIDPADVPVSLKAAWAAIEFGEFAAAAPLVKKSLASPKTELKEGAAVLNDAVQGLIQAQLAEAPPLAEAGKKWQLYKLYTSVGQRFAGFSLPDDVVAQAKALAEDEQVKPQIVAMKQLDTIKRSLNSTAASARRSAGARLKKLIEDSPETDAAQEAKTLLANLGG